MEERKGWIGSREREQEKNGRRLSGRVETLKTKSGRGGRRDDEVEEEWNREKKVN